MRSTNCARSRRTRTTQARAQIHAQTVLIYRDGHTEEVENYAIVGKTIWVFNESRAKKIPLTDLNLDATKRDNDDRGIEFVVPTSADAFFPNRSAAVPAAFPFLILPRRTFMHYSCCIYSLRQHGMRNLIGRESRNASSRAHKVAMVTVRTEGLSESLGLPDANYSFRSASFQRPRRHRRQRRRTSSRSCRASTTAICRLAFASRDSSATSPAAAPVEKRRGVRCWIWKPFSTIRAASGKTAGSAFPKRGSADTRCTYFRLTCKSRANGAIGDRSDALRFRFTQHGEPWLRIPISYALKLSLADLIGAQPHLPEPCARKLRG